MLSGKGVSFSDCVRSSSRQAPHPQAVAAPWPGPSRSRSVHLRRSWNATSSALRCAASAGANEAADSTPRKRSISRKTKQKASSSAELEEYQLSQATVSGAASPAAAAAEEQYEKESMQEPGMQLAKTASAADATDLGQPVAPPPPPTPPPAAQKQSAAVPKNSTRSSSSSQRSTTTSKSSKPLLGPQRAVQQSLPHVLILHTGGTLGMDVKESFDKDPDDPVQVHLKKGTGGSYKGLQPGTMLQNLFMQVPELSSFANIDLQVVFNKDSSRVGPKEWVQIAKILDKNRRDYDAFLVVHGTDTMAYTASALSLMLTGFKKPIVLTGSQLPLSSPRSDARQNLIDALTCATAAYKPPPVELMEVAVCFGGRLMRGNRAQKLNSSSYQAFGSPSYPALAELGIDVAWNRRYLLNVERQYTPRFNLNPAVVRIPIVPGSDPRLTYGDLAGRGVKGVVLEAFGVGNMPDLPNQGWIPWLRDQTKKKLQIYLSSQCQLGELHPELYKSGALAMEMGVEAGPQMTPECAVVKMMLCLCYPDIPLGVPLAGEL